jgi:hypothetical protein
MSAAVTVPNTSPAPLVEVVPAALVETIAGQIAAASAIQVVTAENLDAANASAIALHAAEKALTDHVERIKKPLNSVLKAVRECHANAEAPLLAAKRSIHDKLAAWKAAETRRMQEEQRRRDDAQRRAREEAEAERKRLQAIADQEAKNKADELAKLIGEPVEVKPERIEVKAAPVVPATPIPAPKPLAIQTRMVPELVIDDPRLVPAYVGGVEVRPIDRAAVKRVLQSGVAVEGARMVVREQVASGRISP